MSGREFVRAERQKELARSGALHDGAVSRCDYCGRVEWHRRMRFEYRCEGCGAAVRYFPQPEPVSWVRRFSLLFLRTLVPFLP